MDRRLSHSVIVLVLLAGVWQGVGADENGLTVARNINCSTFDDSLRDCELHNFGHDKKFKYGDSIYSFTDNPVTQFFVYKILDDDNENSGINSLENIFSDEKDHIILIKYKTYFSCGGKHRKFIEIDYIFDEHLHNDGLQAWLLKSFYYEKEVTITINVTAEDGFDNEECHDLSVCKGKSDSHNVYETKKNLKNMFCVVTQMVSKHNIS